jgi:predicted transposase YbfD/YdcC
VCERLEAQVIAIDGKAARGSFDRATGQPAIRVVSAWATQQRLVLTERTVDHKSNESPAIKALLEILEIRGCTVTLDAMGCQKDIAAVIKAKGADYVLILKGSQGNICTAVETLFARWQEQEFAHLSHSYHRQVEAGHGRIETRQHWSVNLSDFAAPELLKQWPHLVAIGRVESEAKIWDNSRKDIRYYLMSRSMRAKELGQVVRQHWQVENSLHYLLDVTFKEDDSRVRKGNGPENLAMIRRLALSLMKQHPGKGSMKKKHFREGLSDEFLLQIIRLGCKTEQPDVALSITT